MIRLIFLFIIFNICIYAHPHVFFTGEFQLNVNNNKVDTLDMTIFLDEMNTAIFTENISDKNNITDKDLSFYKDIIYDLKIEWNGEEKTFIPVFKEAVIEDSSLKIEITVPIEEKIKSNDSILFAIYDTEYFYTYDYEKENLCININNTDFPAKFSLKENKKKAFYYGMVYPKEYEVKFY
ncbi:DUF1007 family protein [Fusobacterium sp.]|uniref:DUF1007 family protein n=1 Tax=Fusobacterium sp. TaxID=68766 RepID=UPI00396C55FA